MPDQIGRIPVPALLPSLDFPLRTDFAHGRARKRDVVVHTFNDATGKVEQRFFVGSPATRYTFRRNALTNPNRAALRAFWNAMNGPEQPFFYDVPQEDQTFITTTVCFENAPLTLNDLMDSACSVDGLTFVEIIDAANAPVYTLVGTVTRFPSGGLSSALLDQVQEIIPLIHVQVLDHDVPDIYLSDRRCQVGDISYLPRLTRIGERGGSALMTQSIEGGSDDVQFTFGNSDRVMIALANDTELQKAVIELSLFHVGTGTKLDLWAGEVVDWMSDQGPEFTIQASDIATALALQSPVGNISRTCWKIVGDLNFGCPANPGSTCDLGYFTPDGCVAKGTGVGGVQVRQSFGGQQLSPQAVVIKDNTTGTWGFGKDLVTPTSQINDSAFGGTLPEIWHNDDGIPQRALPVQCRLIDGREESEFYEGIAIVGRGPIGAYTTARMYDSDGDGIAETFLGSTLDGQPHHGFKQTNSSGAFTDSNLGLRQILGTDPAGPGDFFSLDRVGTTTTDPNEIVVGGSVFLNVFAAGTAFCVIRRTDQKGIQPSEITSHNMVAMISRGLDGYTWGGVSRAIVPGMTNPFWVAINTLLRSLGASSTLTDIATQEKYFDVTAAINAANIADTTVNALFGGSTEPQFRFKGSIDTLKPLRDRLQEILNNSLGYYTWSFGKLKLGCRNSAAITTIFTPGNMLWQSLHLEPLKPQFEKLTIEFADTEYLFQKNTVDYTDQDYALRNNRVVNPRASQFGLIGCSTKSQAARIAVCRVREELGGVGVEEQKNARIASWGTTILALDTEAGQVVGLFDNDVPRGANAFRIQSWTLNRDWSIAIKAKTVTASMYDLTQGTTPIDTPVTTQPTQTQIDTGPPPAPLFSAQVAPDDAMAAEVFDLHFATTVNTRTIIQGTWTFTYHDPTIPADPDHTKTVSTTFAYDFFLITPPATTYQQAELDWVLKTELPGMLVTKVCGFVTNVYGDSPTTCITVSLQLAGLPKTIGDANDQYLSAYTAATGQFVIRHFAENETPAGTIDGANVTFTVVHIPDPSTGIHLQRNGVLQVATLDYTLSGSTITMALAPVDGEALRVSYRYA